MAGRDPRVDFVSLSRDLRAVAQPTRLELLQKLQRPRELADLRVAPTLARAGARGDRPLTRQAVEHHLRQLQRLGLVRARTLHRGGRRVNEYVVSHARLFLILEHLKQVMQVTGAPLATTGFPDEAPRGGRGPLPGPALLLVAGPLEGTAFPLRGEGPWTVGRDPGANVRLLYDPFVSKLNTRIARAGPGFAVEALAGARNGTSLNWGRLRDGEASPLAPGDVLGVGHSVLVFRGP